MAELNEREEKLIELLDKIVTNLNKVRNRVSQSQTEPCLEVDEAFVAYPIIDLVEDMVGALKVIYTAQSDVAIINDSVITLRNATSRAQNSLATVSVIRKAVHVERLKVQGTTTNTNSSGGS